MPVWYPYKWKEFFWKEILCEAKESAKPGKKEHYTMMPQKEIGELPDEQAGSTYGKYEGEQEYARQRTETSYEQILRDRPAEKVYPPMMDSTNMFRLLVFVIAMVSLLAFVVVCLVLVGGTGGWIGFCAASFAILVIASTLIGMKREGEK